LGGNRVKKWRWRFNLFVTFLISGIWHGANWTFILWGGLNGIYIVLETLFIGKSNASNIPLHPPLYHKIRGVIKILFVFCLTCFAWIFFRAENISDSFYIIAHLFSGVLDFFKNLANIGFVNGVLNKFGITRFEFILSWLLIIVLFLIEMVKYELSIFDRIKNTPTFFRYLLYYAIILSIIFFGTFNSTQQFIYFQF
jgi:alginate O-acetyltransferase complex protein AlgI